MKAYAYTVQLLVMSNKFGKRHQQLLFWVHFNQLNILEET